MQPEPICNCGILSVRQQAFDARTGPRVGDYLRLQVVDARAPSLTRFTYAIENEAGVVGGLQTGGCRYGSYYLGSRGLLSYSGQLDPPVDASRIIDTGETEPGCVWFFSGDEHRAGNAVEFELPMRVFTAAPGYDLGWIPSAGTGRRLYYRESGGHAGYRWFVTHHGISEVAFAEEEELLAWLRYKKLGLRKPSKEAQIVVWPAQDLVVGL